MWRWSSKRIRCLISISGFFQSLHIHICCRLCPFLMLPVTRPRLRACRPAAVLRAVTTGSIRLKPKTSVCGHLSIKGYAKSLLIKPMPLKTIHTNKSAHRINQAYQYTAWIADKMGLYWLYTCMVFMCVTSVSLLLQISVYGTLLLSWSMLEMGDNLHDIGQSSASLHQFLQVYCNRWRDIIQRERLARQLESSKVALPAYSSLEEGEMRLLVLEPGTQNSFVRCKLYTCSQNDRIPYQALSYTWGDPTKVQSIDCNGEDMQIASNLHQALLHLCHPRRTRILWIDALCINQDDSNERGQQVQLMREIYAQATQVIA